MLLRIATFCIATSVIYSGSDRVVAADNDAEWFNEAYPVAQALDLLSLPEVERELDLTPDLRDEIASLKQVVERQQREMYEANRLKEKLESAAERNAAANDFMDKLKAFENKYRPPVWALLSSEQRHRFHQLLWQNNIAGAFLFDKEVRARIPIAVGQANTIRDVNRQFWKDKASIRVPKDGFRVEEIKVMEKRDKAILQVLTDEQKSKWSELVGPPFDVRVLRRAVGAAGM